MPARETIDFEVRRDDLRQTRVSRHPPAALADDAVRVRVDRFAFTANNVTYGVVGEQIGYWGFFPAEPGWGRIPVWGFGDVSESRHPDVEVGVRVFGYFPMSTEIVMQPGDAHPEGFVDHAPHRRGLPPVYSRYVATSADPLWQADREDHLMLFRPLFMTAFLIDDFLAERDLFGAEAVVIASASSKTAIGLAHCLSAGARAPGGVVGLTSPGHRRFVESLGCYDRMVTYDAIPHLPSDRPAVLVDMAGNDGVRRAVHAHLGDALRHSCLVGVTHWEAGAPSSEPLPGPQPEFFFAPTRIEERTRDWGPLGLQHRVAEAWTGFLDFTDGWLRVVHGVGPADVERVYRDTLEGRVEPREGHVLSLATG
jgi:hypothetical protein